MLNDSAVVSDRESAVLLLALVCTWFNSPIDWCVITQYIRCLVPIRCSNPNIAHALLNWACELASLELLRLLVCSLPQGRTCSAITFARRCGCHESP